MIVSDVTSRITLDDTRARAQPFALMVTQAFLEAATRFGSFGPLTLLLEASGHARESAFAVFFITCDTPASRIFPTDFCDLK